MSFPISLDRRRPVDRAAEKAYFVRGRNTSVAAVLHRWWCMKHQLPFVRVEHLSDEWGDRAIIELDMTPTRCADFS